MKDIANHSNAESIMKEKQWKELQSVEHLFSSSELLPGLQSFHK